MLEQIIVKLLNYLGDSCGFDYDDCKYAAGLTDQEVERCKELIEEDKYNV